jgi:enoyl-CoA hydratase/carnithine racemase
MSEAWRVLKEWPELVLERLEGAGVARIILNRPNKRNCLNAPLVTAFFQALDIIRPDRDLKVVITKGAGPVYSSGLDLNFLRSVNAGPPRDWDRPTPTIQLAEALRIFPRVTIAQVHGYCLGGALGIMNMHDIVIAADDAQLGMPEILRGSFGQLVTSTLLNGRIPIKKVAWMQLVGRNISGAEADRLGIVSQRPGGRVGVHDRSNRARDRLAPPGAPGARQDRGANGPRSLAVASNPARSAGRGEVISLISSAS